METCRFETANKNRAFRLLSLILLFLPLQLFAQVESLPESQAVKTENPPQIDGLVTDQVWSSAPVAGNFTQQNPDFGAAASEKTEVRILYDESTLYVGVICFESEPDRILISQSLRDGSLIDDDSIQLVLDTYNDNQNGYFFGTNPTGVEYDGQITKEGRSGGQLGGGGSGGRQSTNQAGALGGINLNWDGSWVVEAQITQRGWEAEFAIPFSTISYGSKDTWGLNVLRIIRRKNEQAFWAPIPRSFTLYKVSLAGNLTGLEVTAGRSINVVPYVLAGAQSDDDPTTEEGIFEAGVDVKYGLTPQLNLDLTYNTDFAQVEVDEQQVNLTRFGLFFPEKRPFFLENAGFFQFGTPQQTELFFSRRIGLNESGQTVPIIGGARLTGKMGRYSLGLLDIQTEEVGLVPGDNFFIGRVNREFGTRSTVGAVFANRQSNLSNDHNRSFGVDSTLGLGQNLTIFSYLAKTDTPGLEGDDVAGRVFLDYNSETWFVQSGYTEVRDNFNPDMGFVLRRDFRLPEGSVHYYHRPENSWIRRHDPHTTWRRWYGTDGLLESEFHHFHYSLDLQSGGNFGLAFNRRFELLRVPFEIVPGVQIAPGEYPWKEYRVNYRTNASATLFGSFEYLHGSFYDGIQNLWTLGGGVRSSEKFLFNFNYSLDDIDLPAGAFKVHVARMRVTYSFTPSRLLQGLFQYNSRFNLLSTNIRFSLIRTANSGLFVVYNDAQETVHGGVSRLNRAFLLKYSHHIGL